VAGVGATPKRWEDRNDVAAAETPRNVGETASDKVTEMLRNAPGTTILGLRGNVP
jgi:hypothetical protein